MARRSTWYALAASAALHVAAGAWLTLADEPRRLPLPAPALELVSVELTPAGTPEPVPIEIVTVTGDMPSVAGTAVVSDAPAPVRGASESPVAERPRRERVREAVTAPELPAGGAAGALHMRGGGRPGAPAAVAGAVARFNPVAAAVAALPEVGPPTTERSPLELPGDVAAPRGTGIDLAPSGNGTFRYDRPGFSARVNRDGSVAIRDKRAVDVDVELPCPTCVVRELEQWSRDPYAGNYVNLGGLIPVLAGKFDLNDVVERLIGNDPYQYEKAKFLDRTFDQRSEMAVNERDERERNALFQLSAHLDAVWTSTELDSAQKRAILRQLWLECADTPIGRQARAAIAGYARKRGVHLGDELVEDVD